MKNIKTLSTLVLAAAVIATAQTVNAAIDTGLGAGLGGAVIDSTQGGFAGYDLGTNSADLNFNGSSVVNWSSLNLNSGETLNFNTVDGANGITVLNTVQGGISQIYGDINADNGISHLIISNPNGMLFDGCHFTAGGEVSLNATPMYAEFDENGNMKLVDKRYTQEELGQLNFWDPGYSVVKISVKNSDFTVGGDFSIVAPNINVWDSKISVGGGNGTFKLSTADGYEYIYGGIAANTNDTGRDVDPRTLVSGRTINIQAIEVDGNVEIVIPERGAVVGWHRGGHVTGDLNIDANDCVAINMLSYASQPLTVDGNVNIEANGTIASVNNTTVGGNLDVHNKSGIVEVKDVTVGNDMTLTAEAQRPNRQNKKSEIWMDGNNKVGGNVFLNAIHNILIGNNRGEKSSLTAGGNVSAHAQDGHVMVTSDVTADNISLKSDNFNILTDGEAVLTANTYEFYSNGYIGGLGTCVVEHGAEAQDLRSIVESYTFVPSLTIRAEDGIMYANETFDNLSNSKALIVNGGTITNLIAGYAKIDSLGDLKIENANIAEDMRISAIDSNLDLTSDNIHAQVIYVGDKTDSLTLAAEGRDFITTFFSILHGDTHRPSAIRPDGVVTEDLATSLNTPKEGLERAEDTTELRFVTTPVDPVIPPVEPTEPSMPGDGADNVKVLNSMNNDLLSQATDAAPVNTPTAYAADLDDDDNASAPIRQNVDGSVTIVKEMAAGK